MCLSVAYRLGVRGALLAVRADAGVRRQALRLAAGPLGLLGVALGLAGVHGRDPLAVPAGEPLDLVPLAVDDDGDGVPAPLAHAAHDLHAVRVAVLDGLRADPADTGVAEHLPGLLVEAAALALDLRRLRRPLLLSLRLHADLLLQDLQVLVAEAVDLGDHLVGRHLYSLLVSIFLHFVQEDINLKGE